MNTRVFYLLDWDLGEWKSKAHLFFLDYLTGVRAVGWGRLGPRGEFSKMPPVLFWVNCSKISEVKTYV